MVVKKMVIVVLVLLMAFSGAMVGCSNAGQDNNSESSERAQEEKKLEPATFTWFTGGPGTPSDVAESKDNRVGKIIEDQTGVNVKFERVVGDVKQKIGIMIAAGDYPDLIFGAAGTTPTLVNAKALIPLDELIEQHAPNLKKLYEKNLNAMRDPNDGKLYYLPMLTPIGDKVSAVAAGDAFWIQKAVLKEFGYPKITTLDEYFDLIKRYKEKYPQIDGQDTIGFEVLTEGWRSFALKNPAFYLAGFPNDGKVAVDQQSEKPIFYHFSDSMGRRYVQKLNQLNSEGLLDKESFVQNYDQYIAKLSSGRVLGMFDAAWQFGSAVGALKKQGKEERTWFALPIVFDEGTKDMYFGPRNVPSGEGLGISVKAKDPVRIIQFLDHLAKLETQKLLQWGVEGIDYQVNDEGRFIRTQEQVAEMSTPEWRSKNAGTALFGSFASGTFPDGNAVDPSQQPEVANMQMSELDKEILEAYQVQVPAQLFNLDTGFKKYFPVWSMNIPDGSVAKTVDVKLNDELTPQYWAKAALASPEQFDEIWNEFINKVNDLDLKALEAEIVKQIEYRNENF